MKITKTLTFNVFIESIDGVYVAHCLEAGLIARADDMDELPHKMGKMLSRQIEFALRNNNPADIFHPAPREVWERFWAATSELESTRLNDSDR
jgi:hypothetical protein